MESLYLLFLIFFIILLIIPLGFRGKCFYSLKTNHGVIAIKLWGIKIINLKIKVKGNQILIIKNHKRSKDEIAVGEPELKFLRFFNDEIKDKIKLRSLNCCMRVGLENPFYSAILSSGVSDFILGVFAYIKNKRPSASCNLVTHTSFTENNFILCFNVRMSISILDVIYSIIIAILRTRTDRLIERKIQ